MKQKLLGLNSGTNELRFGGVGWVALFGQLRDGLCHCFAVCGEAVFFARRFPNRHCFSGTPRKCLPPHSGRCGWGSESSRSQMLRKRTGLPWNWRRIGLGPWA